MSKNKQISNKAVPHKSTKAAEALENENRALHATFYATHTPALYQPKGFITSGSKKVSTDSNVGMAKAWNCTERHVSKIRSGRGEPECKPDCNCPKAVKAKAAEALANAGAPA